MGVGGTPKTLRKSYGKIRFKILIYKELLQVRSKIFFELGNICNNYFFKIYLEMFFTRS